MANSALVQHISGNVVLRTICGDPTQTESNAIIKTRGTAPFVSETYTSDRESIREVFLIQGFHNDTVDILMTSWRKG